MASILAPPIPSDTVLTFDINPGTLLQFLASRAEKGPRLKCFEGSVTLVSPGMPHEMAGARLVSLIQAVCLEFGIKHQNLASTTWTLPFGFGDTAYEADYAFYIQSLGTAKPDQPPDLAIEVVVTNPARKALLAGAVLKIAELWVLDLPRRSLTFYHLATRGKSKGTYQVKPVSLAFPLLRSADVLERLEDPELDDTAFHENCRVWARNLRANWPRNGNGGM